jgi:hypothetical protein
MQVPADIAGQADIVDATQRKIQTSSLSKEDFILGAFSVSKVNREWDSNKRLEFPGWSKDNPTAGFTFTFGTPEGEATGVCATEKGAKAAAPEGGTSSGESVQRFACACMGPPGTPPRAEGWITIEGTEAKGFQGEFQGRSVNGQVGMSGKAKSIQVFEDGSKRAEPTGYELRTEKEGAAVEVIFPGRVWLPRTFDAAAKNDVACLAAGLLLYRTPDAE